MPPPIDITGQVFGRLTVERRGKKPSHWECRCECGAQLEISSSSLKRGASKSCGCLRREVMADRQRSHGMSESATYKTYTGMIARCTNQNEPAFVLYGGRGIRVCDRWLGERGFEHFLADMGERPDGLTIDRKDVNGNYEPDNCRWATYETQAQNKRNNKLTHDLAAQIRAAAGTASYRELGRQFGVSDVMVRAVILGRNWKSQPTA